MRSVLVAFALSLVVGATGCATLFGESTQTLTFTSEPQGADVYLDGVLFGRTPVSKPVDKTAGTVVATVRADGYQPQTFVLHKSLDPVAIWNLTFLLSWATDFSTGSMFEYQPGAYYLELAPRSGRRAPHVDRQPFVLASHGELVRELLRGDGESMRTLAVLYQVPPDRLGGFSASLRDSMPQLLAAPTPHEFFGVLDPLALEAAARVL